MPSVLDNLTDSLLTRWRALLGTVPVYDGPQVGENSPPAWVSVGDDADPESDAGNTFEQSWVDMACTRREELGEIVCAVVAESGSTNLSAQRITAYALLATLENDLRADMTLGGAVFSAVIDTGSSRIFQNSGGSAVVVPFVVRYRAHV